MLASEREEAARRLQAEKEAAAAASAALKDMSDACSPAGELGLTPYLDIVRVQRSIPDMCFEVVPCYDRLFVWQVGRADERETYHKDGLIVMPEGTKKRVHQETPQGIVVGAGLKALDNLRTNGIDLGHHITFIRLAPYRIPVGTYGGQEFHLVVMSAGDVVGSAELSLAIKQGWAKRAQTDGDEPFTHWDFSEAPEDEPAFAGCRTQLRPQVPFIGEDY